jgi:hypothetical protein
MKTVFRLIEEHGLTLHGDIEHFAEIIRADERKQVALDKKAENARELGLDYEPDLQAELDATNRQVEILSDALAESRREVDALVALARADEREACAWVCDSLEEQCEKLLVPDEKWPTPSDCANIIRARGNT